VIVEVVDGGIVAYFVIHLLAVLFYIFYLPSIIFEVSNRYHLSVL